MFHNVIVIEIYQSVWSWIDVQSSQELSCSLYFVRKINVVFLQDYQSQIILNISLIYITESGNFFLPTLN